MYYARCYLLLIKIGASSFPVLKKGYIFASVCLSVSVFPCCLVCLTSGLLRMVEFLEIVGSGKGPGTKAVD